MRREREKKIKTRRSNAQEGGHSTPDRYTTLYIHALPTPFQCLHCALCMGFTKPRRRLSTLVPSLSLSLSLFAFKEFHWPIIALAGSLRRWHASWLVVVCVVNLSYSMNSRHRSTILLWTRCFFTVWIRYQSLTGALELSKANEWQKSLSS